MVTLPAGDDGNTVTTGNVLADARVVDLPEPADHLGGRLEPEALLRHGGRQGLPEHRLSRQREPGGHLLQFDRLLADHGVSQHGERAAEADPDHPADHHLGGWVCREQD
jgi:hypothetical protein